MNVSVNQPPALTAAFDAFNQHSSRLEASYRELREQVASLTRKLAREQSARHAELLEKEKLSNRLLRTVEALPGAVVVIDGDGIVQECNRQAVHLLDQPLSGLSWATIVRRECAPRAAANGDLWLKDGRCLSLSRRSLAPEPGEILLLTDVTDSRRLVELMQRNDRLTAIGEMTACLAHQIRTPLTSALLNVGLLNGDDRQQQLAGRVAQRLQDVVRIVDDMLRFAAGAKCVAGDFAVAELFDDIVDTYPESPGSGRLSVEFADRDLRVAGNRDALKGALCNLVDNARQAADRPANVVLSAAASEDSVFLTVADDGPGIPDSARARLFEPFFTTRPQGTGLGLAVVKSVAEAHGGEVLVESGVRGASFTLCMPLHGETE